MDDFVVLPFNCDPIDAVAVLATLDPLEIPVNAESQGHDVQAFCIIS